MFLYNRLQIVGLQAGFYGQLVTEHGTACCWLLPVLDVDRHQHWTSVMQGVFCTVICPLSEVSLCLPIGDVKWTQSSIWFCAYTSLPSTASQLFQPFLYSSPVCLTQIEAHRQGCMWPYAHTIRDAISVQMLF